MNETRDQKYADGSKNYTEHVRPFEVALSRFVDWDKRVINLTCDKCGCKGTEKIKGWCSPDDCDGAGGNCPHCNDGWEDWYTVQVRGDNNVILCPECAEFLDGAINYYGVEVAMGIDEAVKDGLATLVTLAAELGINVGVAIDYNGMIQGVRPPSTDDKEDRHG